MIKALALRALVVYLTAAPNHVVSNTSTNGIKEYLVCMVNHVGVPKNVIIRGDGNCVGENSSQSHSVHFTPADPKGFSFRSAIWGQIINLGCDRHLRRNVFGFGNLNPRGYELGFVPHTQSGGASNVLQLGLKENLTVALVKVKAALAQETVSPMATMSAIEASHWDELHMGYNVDRVNHSEIYSDHGKHTNMVESFFSRLRNMIQGQHHGVSPKYLGQYANHAAWLEDNRRTDNGTLAHIIVSNAMDAPVSRNWKGYWQRAA